MSLADSLKERTTEMHRHAETRPLQKALVAGQVTRHQLAIYLAQLGYVHKAIEDLLATLPHSAMAGFEACSCEHSKAIAEDLKVLDGTASILPETTKIVDELHTRAAEAPLFVVGTLYVLEGSMNGNKYIARGLASSLGIKPGEPGLSYWDPYGDEQLERWQAFRKALDDLHLTDAEQHAVQDGAAFMFSAVAEIADAVALEAGLIPAV